jgi:hypothetical protein
MINRLINKFHTLRDQHVLRLPDRAANPYLTHIPILLQVARWRTLSSVLEFGCGEVSTRAFLDERYFPNLQQLVSYENDVNWAKRLQKLLGEDPRLELHLVNGAISSSVEAIDLERFDLVFIDDSVTGEERSATIRTVAAKRPRRPLVVIHDFEQVMYRVASRSFTHSYRFSGLNPNTGLLWNDAPVCKSQLRALNQLLRTTGERDGVSSWHHVLSSTTI